jgi:Ca2+-dependent lipid-binding protein
MGVITVVLQKVMNIRDKDGVGKSDPYVMLQLERRRLGPDKVLGKHESSRKSNTCNPVYNETFTFHDVDSLNEIELSIKVMDEDVGRDDCLGKVEVDFEHAGLSSTPKEIIAVIDPKRFKLFSTEATIHLLVSYA